MPFSKDHERKQNTHSMTEMHLLMKRIFSIRKVWSSVLLGIVVMVLTTLLVTLFTLEVYIEGGLKFVLIGALALPGVYGIRLIKRAHSKQASELECIRSYLKETEPKIRLLNALIDSEKGEDILHNLLTELALIAQEQFDQETRMLADSGVIGVDQSEETFAQIRANIERAKEHFWTLRDAMADRGFAVGDNIGYYVKLANSGNKDPNNSKAPSVEANE